MMKKIKEGFPEQRLVVVGRELRNRQVSLPVSLHLHITDIGHFPHTENHSVTRKHGISEYIMILCAAGQGTVSLPGGKREITAGQIIFIPPEIPHAYEADDSKPWNIYWFHFSGDQAYEYTELMGIDEENPVLQLSDADPLIHQFETLYSSVMSAFSDPALVRASVELAKTLSLINILRTGRHRKSRKSEQRILASIEYITRHYKEPHTLEQLARQAGLSIPHYTSLFRKQTGTSPLRYLTRVRLRHAENLLDRSTMNVFAIAEAVGYTDTFYFSRVFRKNTGCSPKQYRQLNLKRHGFAPDAENTEPQPALPMGMRS